MRNKMTVLTAAAMVLALLLSGCGKMPKHIEVYADDGAEAAEAGTEQEAPGEDEIAGEEDISAETDETDAGPGPEETVQDDIAPERTAPEAAQYTAPDDTAAVTAETGSGGDGDDTDPADTSDYEEVYSSDAVFDGVWDPARGLIH